MFNTSIVKIKTFYRFPTNEGPHEAESERSETKVFESRRYDNEELKLKFIQLDKKIFGFLLTES